MKALRRGHGLPPAALALAGVLLLPACVVGPNFSKPSPDVPAAWAGTGQGQRRAGTLTAEPVDAAAWWTVFQDPTLTSLVGRAAVSNLGLRAAGLRIAQARTQRDLAAADYWPQLTADASYARTRISEKTATTSLLGLGGSAAGVGTPAGGTAGSIPGLANPFDQYQYGFDASWEADLFGRVRRAVEAADAAAQASVEDRRDIFVSLAGEVGRSYIDLRNAQQDLRIARGNLETQRAILELAAQRRQSGLGTDLDVVNAAATVAGTQAQLPLYQRRIEQAQNQLSVLLGLQPGALRAELDAPQPVPPTPPRVPIGVPAEVVQRRPDIRGAEARLHAATAQIGVATASFFPDLTLNLGLGMQAERAKDLADWASHFLSVGPTLELPILDGGRRRATLRLQDLRAREAAVTYAQTVLDALQEVENAAAAYNTELDRWSALQAVVKNESDALVLARQQYQSGVADFLRVLEAERSLQQAELAEADSRAALSMQLVALYKALGGGWEDAGQGGGQALQ